MLNAAGPGSRAFLYRRQSTVSDGAGSLRSIQIVFSSGTDHGRGFHYPAPRSRTACSLRTGSEIASP